MTVIDNSIRGFVGGETTGPAGLRVYLVPVEHNEANNVLRYGETLVNRDGSFAFTNLAPGGLFHHCATRACGRDRVDTAATFRLGRDNATQSAA